MDNFIYRIGSNTNIIGRPPNFYHSNDLIKRGCTFASVYAVRHEDATAIETTAKTCEGFKGIVWSQRLWVDFDDNDEAIRKALNYLDTNGYDYVVYDTGNRGVHIGILRDAKPSHTLPAQDKAWVSTNLPGADLSLYWHLHLIRLPGTKHEKTGKSKTLVLRKEGGSLQLEPLQERNNLGRAADAVYQKSGDISYKVGSIFSSWEVMSLLQPTGERQQLVKLAAALKRAGATNIGALAMLMEVNFGFEKPREQEELNRIVQWAYNE